MYGFDYLTPACSDSHVTIEKCSNTQGCPYNLFTSTFSNSDGGKVIFDVPNDVIELTFVMTEAE